MLTNVDDLENLIKKSMEALGGKLILYSILLVCLQTVRKDRHYSDLDYNYLEKTLDISAVSFHKVLKSSPETDAINEWGSVVCPSVTWQHNEPSMGTMTWPMPKHCWNPLHEVWLYIRT
jgi:hypothetical protein